MIVLCAGFGLGSQVEPVDDAEVLEDTPGGNFGTLNETITQSRNTHAEISYYAFDLSNISLNMKYANFTYYVYSVANPIGTNNITFLYCNDAGFDETTITWNNRNTEVANCNTTHPLYNKAHNTWTANKWYTFSINSTVNKEITSGDKKFVIKSTFTNIGDPTTSRNIKVTSRESVDNMEPYMNYDLLFNFNISFPVLNKHYNYYNNSLIIYSGASMWCSVNNTNWTINSTSPSTTLRFMNNHPFINEGRYSIFVNCTKQSGLDKYNRTINFTIDRTYPDIFVITPANNTIRNKNFTLTVRYYDLYLYATNTTVRYLGNNSVIFNRLNTSITGTQNWHNLTYKMNIASLPDGNYSIFMTAADTHTVADFKENPQETTTRTTLKGVAVNRKDLKMKKGDITLIYPENVEIKTKKEKDRIIFEHKTKDIRETYEYSIIANKIVYLSDSPYRNHLIINDKYWYDTEGLPDSSILSVSDKEVRIIYKQIRETESSRSLGGLNEINSSSRFFVDKTVPNMTSNTTQGYGNNIIFRFNATEPVKYNATIMLRNCSGNITRFISNATYATSHYFRSRYFDLNETYYIRIQITDNANNNQTYCQNVTTGEYENYIDNYYYAIDYTNNQIRFYVSAIDTNEHPLVLNYTAFKNGILTNSYIATYYMTDIRYIYKVENLIYYQTNNFMNSSISQCMLPGEDHINLRWWSSNTIGLNDIELSCSNGTSWVYVTDWPLETRLFDEYMHFNTNNGTNLTIEAMNYTAVGNWTNISRVFDGNSSSFAECNGNWDNCYLYLTYPLYYQTLYGSGVLYNLFNFSNLSTGSYYTMISVWDGRYVYPMINASFVISFNANLYNELTGQLIDDRLSHLSLISEGVTPTINKYQNTTTGIWNVLDLIVADYNLLYDSLGYNQRHYYLIGDDLNLNGTLDLFLLNDTVGEYSIVQVIDQNLQPLEGVIVKVYKNIPYFTEKQIISVLKTNFEGEATLDFRKYIDDYTFVVVRDGRIIKVSSPTQVSKDVVQIQVELSSEVLDSIAIMNNATGYVDIYNSTNPAFNRTCAYAWSGADINYGCAEVIERGLSKNDVQLCRSCVSGSSGIVTCDFTIQSGFAYYCNGIIDTNTTGSEFTILQEILEFKTNINPFGLLGVLIAWIIFMTMSLLFKETPSLSILAGTIGLIVASLMSMISIPLSGLMIIICIAGFFIMRLRG
jgi:hypothetical protein